MSLLPPRFQQLIVAAVKSGLRRALDKLAEPARSKVVGDISKAAPPPPLNGRLMP